MMPAGIEAALGKGLGNYLCLRRYNELRGSAAATGDPSIRRSLPLLETWTPNTETGRHSRRDVINDRSAGR